MSQDRKTTIVENTPELVALKLVKIIARSEGKHAEPDQADVDRSWLLDTYAECLKAVRGERVPQSDARLRREISA